MDKSENFHQQLRDIIPDIKEARINVLKFEVNLKKVFWIELCKAKEDGERSYNAQKSKAEASESYFNASLQVANAKARRDAVYPERAAIAMQGEEWRTAMANLRMERSRYGA